MKTLVPLLALLLALSGCASTEYITTKPDGSSTKVKAVTIGVARNLGKVTIGADSLDSSVSNQMQAVSDALGLAKTLAEKGP